MSASTCPGDCCAQFYILNDDLADIINRNLIETDPLIRDDGRSQTEHHAVMYSLLVPLDDDGSNTCAAFDRSTRRCTAYEKRPYICSEYPYFKPCVHCTYDQTDGMPGVRYGAIEETGIFAHDDQPALPDRLEHVQ